MKALTVYKASAGSGKTFTLATEYIKLLVLNPASYRTILAVTFTNKATEEMKMRILSQLYGIWKQLPDSNRYTEKVVETTGLAPRIVSQRAGEALHLLLHNYNYFRVETIDTFFQSVLRNLARELDLTANLHIGLNDGQVEEMAVDQLIDNLTHTDVMLQWLLKYIMETISDDKSWNIIGRVKTFGKTIFQDYYKEQSRRLNEQIGQEGFFEHYMQQMRDIRDQAKAHMQEIAESFFDTLEGESLTINDLSHGPSGVAGFFLKLRNGVFDESTVGKRVSDCNGDPTKWYKKTHPQASYIHQVAESSLMQLLHYAIEERPRQWRLYQSATLTIRHLNQLRLLSSIEQKVRELNEESNRFLLSDTQQFLHALIKESDSPFIFEKIGTQLEHIMIDEFQDTSTVQWENFKVLLLECMSHADTENLIVGDVKQSIYRWRSGDWRLLNAIDTQFPSAEAQVEIRPLDTNYRSERHIILFNNAFFTTAAEHEYNQLREESTAEAEQLLKAYSDVVQKVPVNRDSNGKVAITLLPSTDYQQQMLAQLEEQVGMLLGNGIAPQRIAILVRTNNYIPIIAEHFAQHMGDVRIVSDEAFRLDASEAVCLMVQALHLLAHPDDLLAKAYVAKVYQQKVLGNRQLDNELLLRDAQMDRLLPEAYAAHTAELAQLPVYELAERLYALFQLDRLNDQSAYVCAFFDHLNEFVRENSSDIDDLLTEWEETLCHKTIQNDNVNGIRLLSIHKSKGLEFDNVIIPFCDWTLEKSQGNILWCQPTMEPFSALPVIPVDFSRGGMMGTIFEDDYLEEHLQNVVDNLNLLYVAFTRASQNLFVIGQRNSTSTRSALLEAVLPLVCKQLEGAVLSGEEDQQAPLVFDYGTLCTRQHTAREESKNIFLQPVTPQAITIETFTSKTEFRQSNRSRAFIEGDDEESTSYIKLGSVLHNIFSTIRTTDDIEQALRQLQADGVLYDEDITAERITHMLRKRLQDPRVADWFSRRWQLFNECTILSIDADGRVSERRPDRVMTDGQQTVVVDFKFGHPREEYHQQVRQYMQLLRSMGHPNVSGWLWFVYSNRIEEVKFEA